VLVVPPVALTPNVGASFTAVTVIVPVAVLLEYAVLPPFVLTSAVAPAVPLVWSHARYVTVAVPLKSAVGTKRTLVFASSPLSSRAALALTPVSVVHATPAFVE
jgi:hypothetical protein